MTSNLSKMRAAHKAHTAPVETQSKTLAPVKVQSVLAHDAVNEVFPHAYEPVKVVLANTLHAVFARALNNQSEYTPFSSTPDGAISYPKFVIDLLRKVGARMPTTSEGDSGYRPRPDATITSMSELSHVAKSSLSSVNAGRQQLTVPDLEKWRIAVAKVGEANPDIPEVAELEFLSDPVIFFRTLLENWAKLDSTLQLSRIKEWAVEYSTLTQEGIDNAVEKARPSPAGYLRSMVKVWREEYEQGAMADYLSASSMLDIFNTRTSGRRLGRGFNVMINSVHEGMIQFNQRVRYPQTSYASYKARYSSDHTETGLSAEVLMGYCLFLGINPIAVLQWIAVKETKSPGTWTAHRAADLNGLINWQGAISPRECLRFYETIQHMGLVSDQNIWSLYLLHPSFIYKNLPTEDAARDALGADMLMSDIVDEYFACRLFLPQGIKNLENCGHTTLFGKAQSEGLAINAFNLPFALTLAAYGVANGKMTKELVEKAVAELDAITDETELLNAARKSFGIFLGTTGKNYAEYEMGEPDEKGRVKVNPSVSYKNTALDDQQPVAKGFYNQLLVEFPAK